MVNRDYILRTGVVLCFGILFLGACRGGASKKTTPTQSTPMVIEKKRPKHYSYSIEAIYPHNTTSYTQGLFWHDGRLWESTGEYGRSALMEVELTTGVVLRRVALGNKYFGEGAEILDGKIYQLTWMEGVVFVYDAVTLRKMKEFKYFGEGWGLATDGKKLYMSDGSHRIYVVNPIDFKREATINVKNGRRYVEYINEMEWIRGRIWANIYGSDTVVIIDPATGEVEGVVDFTGLLPLSDHTPDTDVLNGIAYDQATERVFVTGKNWKKLFQIKLVENNE